MENLQVLVYIIFGIIYIIFSVLKKRNKGPESGTPPLFDDEDMRGGDPYRQEDPANRPPASLEELLDRYDHAKQRAKERAADKMETMQEQVDDEFIPVAPKQPVIRNMEQEALEQMERTERLKTLQEELPAKARAELLQREKPAVKPAQLKKRVVENKRLKERERRFKPYEKQQQTPVANQLRTLLSTRQGMRQAVLLSEILNRKEF